MTRGDDPIIVASEKVEIARSDLATAKSGLAACCASKADILAGGDTSPEAVARLTAEEAREKLYLSKIRNLETALRAAVVALQRALIARADTAAAESQFVRGEAETRIRKFLSCECAAECVPALTIAVLAASMPAKASARVLEVLRSAAGVSGGPEQVLAAASRVLSLRSPATEMPPST